MRRRVRLGLCDFWKGFDRERNAIVRLLRTRFDIEWSPRPEFLLYSVFGEEHHHYDCVRVFITGENRRPNWNECDYAFTFDHSDHERHFRWPLYAQYGDVFSLVKPANHDAEAVLRGKTKFCNFVFSNPHCAVRNRFFDLLSRYKRVDAGGKVRNNLGHCVANKDAFLRDYKFTIAFENDSYPGYTTEKIAQPMWANSLPIYWGNPLVHLDFNPASFVNFCDQPNLETLVERVIELDRHDDLYLQCASQPWFHGNAVPDCVDPARVLDQFEHIFSTAITPVSQAKRLSFPARSRLRLRAARQWAKRQFRRQAA